MYISVTFLGLQRQLARTNHIQIPLGERTCVADVLAHIKEQYPELTFPDHAFLVAVNDKISSMERILENKDNVTFLPLVGGG